MFRNHTDVTRSGTLWIHSVILLPTRNWDVWGNGLWQVCNGNHLGVGHLIHYWPNSPPLCNILLWPIHPPQFGLECDGNVEASFFEYSLCGGNVFFSKEPLFVPQYWNRLQNMHVKDLFIILIPFANFLHWHYWIMILKFSGHTLAIMTNKIGGLQVKYFTRISYHIQPKVKCVYREVLGRIQSHNTVNSQVFVTTNTSGSRKIEIVFLKM